MSTLTTADTVRVPTAIGRFGLHFIEMCVVMCMGGALLDAAIFSGLALLGYPNVAADAPALAIFIITFDFVAVMAGYMALRRHPMQHNLEMSGSTAIGGILLMVALWLGWIPATAYIAWYKLFAFACTPLCVLMFVVMLARFDHYGGRIGSAAAATSAGPYTCSMHPEVRRARPGACPVCGMTLVRRDET